MNIQSIEIEKLNPAVYNPRKDLSPEDPEYQKLKKSILEFQHILPVVWNKRSGNLVGGHQTIKILKELGKKTVTVSVVDLPDNKEKALNIALNKLSGDWDYPKLKDLIVDLDVGDIDIELTGFDELELEELFGYSKEEFDIDEIVDYTEKVNFIIKCENIDQLETVKARFKTQAQKISFEKFNEYVVMHEEHEPME